MSAFAVAPPAPTPSSEPLAATDAPAPDPVFEVLRPAVQTLPLVIASPHSGNLYPPEFVAASRLDPLALRRSEDSFVDELFGAAPAMGAPLLRALFPRAYVDPNREPWELDPAMFEDALPAFANTRSARVAAGLGTVARVVANGAEIYRGKLSFADARDRIERCYRPYHAALAELIEDTRRQFGWCLLIDGHSMPSIGGPMERDAGVPRVDFVLGDCFGAACDPRIIDTADRCLRSFGYLVTRNDPYAGGFTTRHYGRPAERVHALQIEINRALYMDEGRYARSSGFPAVLGHLTRLIDRVGRLEIGGKQA
ncbi:MAG: N-formylglutamate amidohydrolase [Alphaproteobacteria bacterium]|nr:N-formylglutamate amidohydrolase [Alphaproteobacteria bacterium]TAD87075.1 MAG: N-formylglutamate amidohydrolase [Alphaproteobacteria bacterium]